MVGLLSLVTLFLLFSNVSASAESASEAYHWYERHRYYFSSLETKMKDVLSEGCRKKLVVLNDGVILPPTSSAVVNVASMPAKGEVVKWWKELRKPQQMRVDPNLCDAVLTKRVPIFNNTGCQLKGYMSPSAPRCQNKYLKYICDHSRIPIDDSRKNSFVLPESDHSTAELPPQPWLLTAKDSFVSMCGQISSYCGLIHTTSNCMGGTSSYQADLFHQNCSPYLSENVSLVSAFGCLRYTENCLDRTSEMTPKTDSAAIYPTLDSCMCLMFSYTFKYRIGEITPECWIVRYSL